MLERYVLMNLCMSAAQANREQSMSMTSSAGLELFWSVVALGSALLALVAPDPLSLAAVAAIGSALALLAHVGELAEGPHTAPEAVGINVIGGLVALMLASLSLAGVVPIVLAPVALLVVGAMIVLDAPYEPELAAPRGAIAGGYMVLAGLAALIVLTAGFSARASGVYLLPWAALLIASAQVVGALALLARFARR